MTKFKVGITDYVPAPFSIEQTMFGDDTELVFLNAVEEEDFDLNLLRDLDALLVWHAHITSAVVQALHTCKIIVRYGVGYDNIDLDAIGQKGIVFCNTPDYGTEEVADTATSMALALSRGILRYNQLSKSYSDGWQENTIPGLQRLSSCTVGIIGVGRIGTSVMRRFRPFGTRIVGYDPYLPSGHEKALGYERSSTLEGLLGQSDIVSIHCPLSAETQAMVNADFISSMKPHSILINSARGQLIQSTDLIYDALKNNTLWGVGLDVLPHEPPRNDRLFQAWREQPSWLEGRLIINPHTAYYSEQAWVEMRQKTAETAALFLRGGTLRNQITV